MNGLLSITLTLVVLLSGCASTAEVQTDAISAETSVSASDKAVPAKTIDKDGDYTLTGTIDGQVLVTAAKVTLILDNATVRCADGSAILGEDNDAKNLQNLTIKLVGNSAVSGGKHGIQGKDNLTITGDGTLAVTAVKDGLHAGDALDFKSGTVNILSSYEGVEAAYVNLSGGSLTTHASDDGVNAASDEEGVTPSVTISGGTHYIYAGSDGIDSNGTLTISGGTTAVLIYAPRDGQTFDADRPGTVLPTLHMQGQFAAGDTIGVADAQGKIFYEVTLDTAVTAAAFTLPGLADGTAYRVLQNGAALSSVTATSAVAAGMGGGFGGGFPGGQGGRVPPEGLAPPGGQPGGGFRGHPDKDAGLAPGGAEKT